MSNGTAGSSHDKSAAQYGKLSTVPGSGGGGGGGGRGHNNNRSTNRGMLAVLLLAAVVVWTNTLSFQGQSVDFMAYVQFRIGTTTDTVAVAAAATTSAATTPTKDVAIVTPSSDTDNTDTLAPTAAISTVKANLAPTISPTPINSTTATAVTAERSVQTNTNSPTSSPSSYHTTQSPTTTERVVRNWTQFWKAALVIKQQAAASLQADSQNGTIGIGYTTSFPTPDAPLQLLRLPIPQWESSLAFNTTFYNSSRPVVAIVTSTFSKGSSHLPMEHALLIKHLLPSIIRTVTAEERQQWRVHLYVAVDDTDAWWLQHWNHIVFHNMTDLSNSPDAGSDADVTAAAAAAVHDGWFNVTFGVFPTRTGDIPFDEMAAVAYREGAEYYCRVNDDTEFTTPNWITHAVHVLRNVYDPPNIGVVAPHCNQGNAAVMTHDFVHRTHLDIFQGYYYPPIFDNWFLDDWITSVYSRRVWGPSFHRGTVLRNHPDVWEVTHWTSPSRYDHRYLHVQWLPFEYTRSHYLVSAYLQREYPNHEVTRSLSRSLPQPQRMDTAMVDSIRAVLPLNGTLLVWGLDVDSPYWHRASSNNVVFMAEPETHQLYHKADPYLIMERAIYTAGKRGDFEYNHQTFVLANNSGTLNGKNWCHLHMDLPDSVRETPVWNVILVSAPRVCNSFEWCSVEVGPGIFQPLYMSYVIAATQLAQSLHSANANQAQATTHVFVQDYQRNYEREFATLLFGQPQAVVSGRDPSTNATKELAHFVVDAQTTLPSAYNASDDCPLLMDIKPSAHYVPWTYPNEAAIAASSLAQAPQSWIIYIEVNLGYYELLLNWLEHFVRLEILPRVAVVIRANDATVHARIVNELLPLYASTVSLSVEPSPKTADINHASSFPNITTVSADWGTPIFDQIVSVQPAHLRDKLVQGVNVIYTDVDTVWRRNPLPYLSATGASGAGSAAADLVAAVNSVEQDGYSPYYSAGFLAMASNERTVALVSQWAEYHEHTTTSMTASLNRFLNQSQVRHQPLPWQEFPTGFLHFEQYQDRQRAKAVVVHNDFILSAHNKKGSL